MILLTSQLRIIWQIAWRRHQQMQTTWSQLWKQGDYWMLTSIQMLEHSWIIGPFCLHGEEHSCTQERRMFSSWTLWRFLEPILREGPFHVMFVRNPYNDEKKENYKYVRVWRCYENNVCTCRLTHLLLMDDGVISDENITFVLGSYDHFSQCFTFFSQHGEHVSIKIDLCWQSKHMDTEFFWALWKSGRRSPGTTSTWCLMRRIWNQKDSQRRLKTQALIQVPWEWVNGTTNQLEKMSNLTFHLQAAWAMF